MEDCDPLVSSLLNPRPGKMEYLACVYLYVCSFHDDDRASTIPGTVIYVVYQSGTVRVCWTGKYQKDFFKAPTRYTKPTFDGKK